MDVQTDSCTNIHTDIQKKDVQIHKKTDRTNRYTNRQEKKQTYLGKRLTIGKKVVLKANMFCTGNT